MSRNNLLFHSLNRYSKPIWFSLNQSSKFDVARINDYGYRRRKFKFFQTDLAYTLWIRYDSSLIYRRYFTKYDVLEEINTIADKQKSLDLYCQRAQRTLKDYKL